MTKTILQLNDKKQIIKEWNFYKDIIKENPKFKKVSILSAIKTNLKYRAYGYFWKYSEKDVIPFKYPPEHIDETGKEELWIDIFEFEGKYQLSNKGRVYSIIKQKFLKPQIREGYPQVCLDYKQYNIYWLLGIHFIEDSEESDKKRIINHIDHNRKNSSLENLEWTDANGNAKAYQEFRVQGKILQLNLKGKIIKIWDCFKDIFKENPNYKESNIRSCLFNKRKNTYRSIWKFEKMKPKKQEAKTYDYFNDEIYTNIGIIKDNDFSLYEISNYGKVRKIIDKSYFNIKYRMNKDGYCIIDLAIKNKNKRITISIHRLVANVYCCNPFKDSNLPLVINHIDKNRDNNYYKNLEWVTAKGNSMHSIAKKVKQLDLKTGKTIKNFNSIKEAAEFLNSPGSAGNITRVCKNISKSCKGYGWKYIE